MRWSCGAIEVSSVRHVDCGAAVARLLKGVAGRVRSAGAAPATQRCFNPRSAFQEQSVWPLVGRGILPITGPASATTRPAAPLAAEFAQSRRWRPHWSAAAPEEMFAASASHSNIVSSLTRSANVLHVPQTTCGVRMRWPRTSGAPRPLMSTPICQSRDRHECCICVSVASSENSPTQQSVVYIGAWRIAS